MFLSNWTPSIFTEKERAASGFRRGYTINLARTMIGYQLRGNGAISLTQQGLKSNHLTLV